MKNEEKDFLIGKWYKCVKGDEIYLYKGDYYQYIKQSADSNCIGVTDGWRDIAHRAKSRFDLDSELDHEPIKEVKPNPEYTCTLYVKFKSDKTGRYEGKEYAYKATKEQYDSIKSLKTYYAEVEVAGVRREVKVVNRSWLLDDKATKNIISVFSEKEVDTEVKESKIDNVVSVKLTGKSTYPFGEAECYTKFVEDLKAALPPFMSTAEFAKKAINHLNQQEEVNMAQVNRKSVKVELFDNDSGLPVEQSLVGHWDNYVTEDSDSVTIQEIISTGEVANLLKQHNEVRTGLVDEEILKRTGNAVKLRPIKLKDLTWLVDGRKVN